MKYNFETVTKRYDIGVPKYENILKSNPAYKEMDIIPFSVADMELQNAPQITEGLKKYIDTYSMGYVHTYDAYLEAVCGWMKRRHGWDVDKSWILDTHGVQEAFYNIVKLYTDPGDGVIVMAPHYSPLYEAIMINDRVALENTLINVDGKYEIDFDDFEAKAKDPSTKLFLLCSPQNPTGRVFTKEELERLGRICIDNDVLICADEIHCDFISPGYTFTPFASISEEFAQHSMICTSPSKTFSLPGLQTASLIVPNETLREKFLDYQKSIAHFPKLAGLGYEACMLAYNEAEEWFDECQKLIETNRQLIVKFFEENYPSIKVTELEGTYLMWIDFRSLDIPAEELADLLKTEAQLFFSDGYSFGDCGRGFERWNVACPTRYIEEALDRLKVFLDKHMK